MILQTGGLLFGEISTRSMPASIAIFTATDVSVTPTLTPFWSISWTSRLRISSLVRGPSLATVGGALLGRRMGRSPRLLKEATILKEFRGAGKARKGASR